MIACDYAIACNCVIAHEYPIIAHNYVNIAHSYVIIARNYVTVCNYISPAHQLKLSKLTETAEVGLRKILRFSIFFAFFAFFFTFRLAADLLARLEVSASTHPSGSVSELLSLELRWFCYKEIRII